jgi:hypothetical protein
MKTSIDFLNWLSKKLYLATIGFYLTIGLIMLLPTIFAAMFGIPLHLIVGVTAFSIKFVVVFLRAAYESLLIYEAPVKSLSPKKMLLLSLITATLMTLVSYYAKPSLGYFSIPVSIIISLLLVSRLKTAMWPVTPRHGFFALLPAKLGALSFGRYIFFGFLVGIAYLGYGKYGFNFYVVFATAYFVGMVVEELYNVVKVYEQKLNTKNVVATILWAVLCAGASAAIVWFMMSVLGYAGQAATITSVLVIKLIQPLGSRRFILGL